MLKKILIAIGIVILSFIVKDAFQYQIPETSYADIIHINWSIDISKDYKEIYSTDSGASFHGDGERYNVLQYKNSNDVLLSENFTNSKNTDMEFEVWEILGHLDIPKEYLPDFQNSYQYFATTKEDHSRIYFIFVPDTKKLYVVEMIQ